MISLREITEKLKNKAYGYALMGTCITLGSATSKKKEREWVHRYLTQVYFYLKAGLEPSYVYNLLKLQLKETSSKLPKERKEKVRNISSFIDRTLTNQSLTKEQREQYRDTIDHLCNHIEQEELYNKLEKELSN